MRRVIFFMALVLMISCEKESIEMEALGSNVSIIGTWIESEYRGDTLFLDRNGAFDREKYGFALNDDGSFVEHKNAGWCGTPPITYDSFDGTWKAVSDSLLDITVAYWGGMITYQMRIISVNAEELAIKYLYSEDRTDSR